MSASRATSASCESTGWPSLSTTGRDIRFPSSSVKGSWSWTGKAWARKSSTYSRGVRSMERSSHSEGGISAMRLSVSASPVETSCTTAERPASRSASMARMRVGHFMLVNRCPKNRCFAPSNAE